MDLLPQAKEERQRQKERERERKAVPMSNNRSPIHKSLLSVGRRATGKSSPSTVQRSVLSNLLVTAFPIGALAVHTKIHIDSNDCHVFESENKLFRINEIV